VIAKKLMVHLTGIQGVERVLVYGIYALGLVALAFVLLSSPGSPIVTAGVWQAVAFLAGLTVTYLITYVVGVVSKKYGDDLVMREPHLRTTVTFVRRLVVGLVALIGVAATTFTSFPSAGAAVASIFVAAGFASIVIGLAAQSSLANIFAGMIVSTSQPFRIGDAVLFRNEWCWVEDIRLTFTVLRTWDNRRVVVPNQLFLGETLVNYDLNDSSKLVIVFVQVPYEVDLDRAIALMKEAATRHPDFLPSGNLPVVHVMEYNESGISLRLLGNAKDQPTAFQMSKDLLYQIRKDFLANGIQISYPRREIFLKGSVSEGQMQRSGGHTQ
jgi:small-conductance mechanosensitive channel